MKIRTIFLIWVLPFWGCQNTDDSKVCCVLLSETQTTSFMHGYIDSLKTVENYTIHGGQYISSFFRYDAYLEKYDTYNILELKGYDSSKIKLDGIGIQIEKFPFWFSIQVSGQLAGDEWIYNSDETPVERKERFHKERKKQFGDTTFSGKVKEGFVNTLIGDFGTSQTSYCFTYPIEIDLITEDNYNENFSANTKLNPITKIMYLTPDFVNHKSIMKEFWLSNFNDQAPSLVPNLIHLHLEEAPDISGEYYFEFVVRNTGVELRETIGPIPLEGKDKKIEE